MSNKTQLSTNNTKLASLIQELANKAAGSGGANVETCTVRIISGRSTDNFVSGGIVTVTQYIDGDFVSSAYTWFTHTPVVIENVVCGSVIAIKGITETGFTMGGLSDQMDYLETEDGWAISNPDTLVAVNAPKEPNSVGEICIY